MFQPIRNVLTDSVLGTIIMQVVIVNKQVWIIKAVNLYICLSSKAEIASFYRCARQRGNKLVGVLKIHNNN